MTFFNHMISHISKYSFKSALFNAVSGVVLVVGLASSPTFAQQTVTPEELQAHIAKQQAELDAVIANRDKTQAELEAKRKAYEEQTAKQEAIEAKMKKLCEEQEELQPGSMENCMAGKTTK